MKNPSNLKTDRFDRSLWAVILPLLLATQAAGGYSASQAPNQTSAKGTIVNSPSGSAKKISGYAPINGLKMYYEIEGTGDPLVFIPPAFGFAGLESFPALAQNHSVIAVDLQGNGRTKDIPDRPSPSSNTPKMSSIC